MTSNDTYRSGETPKVGDIVTVSPQSTLNYYSPLRGSYHRTYTVKKVMPGIKSTLVVIDDLKNGIKASQFLLKESVEKRDGKSIVGPRPNLVIDDTGKILGSFDNSKALNAKLSELLTANPGQKYHIYRYDTTAKTKPQVVEFVNLATEGPSVSVSETAKQAEASFLAKKSKFIDVFAEGPKNGMFSKKD